MQVRSRIVARDFKSRIRPDLYAGTPSVEALKAIEDQGKNDAGEIGVSKKSMYGTRDAASTWECDWQNHLKRWDYTWGQISENLFRATRYQE